MSDATLGSDRWVTLAKILRPQGRVGEVLADLSSDFPQTFVGRNLLFLAPEMSEHFTKEWQPCVVTSGWMPKGRNEGRIVLGLAGVTDIAGAERLVGMELRTPLSHRQILAVDETYVTDLIGCELIDQGCVVGRVTDIQFPMTADGHRRNDESPVLLGVSVGAKEVLVPFAKAFLVGVDTTLRQIRMELPRGLVEVQLAAGGAEGISEPTGDA